eukprot:jgi/Mesen1/4474/ME000228S03440
MESGREIRNRLPAGGALPRSIDVREFANARALELQALIATLRKGPSTLDVHSKDRQTSAAKPFALARHLRRRTSSHNRRKVFFKAKAKRHKATGADAAGPSAKSFSEGLPGEVTDATLQGGLDQHAGEGLPQPEPAKGMCRRLRRRFELKGRDGVHRTQTGDGRWRLETHVWHAKRFKMESHWGFCLAQGRPGRGRGSRAVLKWAEEGAVLHDASYYSPVHLSGRKEDLARLLAGVSDPSLPPGSSAPPAGAANGSGAHELSTAVASGACEGHFMLHHHGEFPCGAICPARFLWQAPPPCPRHPAPSPGASSRTGAGATHGSGAGADAGCQVELLLWLHPAAYEEALHTLQVAASRTLARLELVGVGATDVLLKALHPPAARGSPDEVREESGTPSVGSRMREAQAALASAAAAIGEAAAEAEGGDHGDPAERQEGPEGAGAGSHAWALLRQGGGHLPAGTVLALDVHDPRDPPGRRLGGLLGIQDGSHEEEEEGMEEGREGREVHKERKGGEGGDDVGMVGGQQPQPQQRVGERGAALAEDTMQLDGNETRRGGEGGGSGLVLAAGGTAKRRSPGVRSRRPARSVPLSGGTPVHKETTGAQASTPPPPAGSAVNSSAAAVAEWWQAVREAGAGEGPAGVRALAESPSLWGLGKSREGAGGAGLIPQPEPEAALCERRRQRRISLLQTGLLLDGEDLTQGGAAQEARASERETPPGWSLIVPCSWVRAFWVPLVLAGGHVVGLRELRWLATEAKQPLFPHDYPDCAASARHVAHEVHAQLEAYQRKPKGKRPPRPPHAPAWGRLFSDNSDVDKVPAPPPVTAASGSAGEREQGDSEDIEMLDPAAAVGSGGHQQGPEQAASEQAARERACAGLAGAGAGAEVAKGAGGGAEELQRSSGDEAEHDRAVERHCVGGFFVARSRAVLVGCQSHAQEIAVRDGGGGGAQEPGSPPSGGGRPSSPCLHQAQEQGGTGAGAGAGAGAGGGHPGASSRTQQDLRDSRPVWQAVPLHGSHSSAAIATGTHTPTGTADTGTVIGIDTGTGAGTDTVIGTGTGTGVTAEAGSKLGFGAGKGTKVGVGAGAHTGSVSVAGNWPGPGPGMVPGPGGRYLVRMLVRCPRRGVAEEGATICLPTPGDFDAWCSKAKRLQGIPAATPAGAASSPKREPGLLTKKQRKKKERREAEQRSLGALPHGRLGSAEKRNEKASAAREGRGEGGEAREVVGFVTSGNVMGSKAGFATGFCKASALARLKTQQCAHRGGRQAQSTFVLVLNEGSTMYRPAVASSLLDGNCTDEEHY